MIQLQELETWKCDRMMTMMMPMVEGQIDINVEIVVQMRATKTVAYSISPTEIGVLWAKITYVKSFKNFWLWPPNRYEIDLSNEVLNIDFDQEVAKIPEVKVGLQKKYLPIGLVRTHALWVSRVGRYFFQTPTLTSGIFAAPWSKSMFSTSFERSLLYLLVD